MTKDFYDKVAKKFGGYSYGTNNPKYNTEFPDGIPEEDFKNHLLSLSGKDKIALDVGCGDCRFAFGISDNFKEIIGIDTSTELLKIAKSKQKKLKNTNVKILEMNADKLTFSDNYFDVAFSRRGPTPYKEVFRVLKPGGHFVIIEIGEKDTMGLKKVFGRGQGYGNWDNSVSEKEKNLAINAGFKTSFVKEYFYDEYYETYEDLDLFLQGVPIFPDFDPEKDKPLFEKYVDKFLTQKGINLPRHRVVFVLQK